MQKHISVSRRIPLEPRAIGPVLSHAQRRRDIKVTVETTAHGDTRAYVERPRARAVPK